MIRAKNIFKQKSLAEFLYPVSPGLQGNQNTIDLIFMNAPKNRKIQNKIQCKNNWKG